MGKAKAKVFMTGRSQAVRLPKRFRFECDEVFVERHGDGLILTPKRNSWKDYFSSGKRFSDDYPEIINKGLQEK